MNESYGAVLLNDNLAEFLLTGAMSGTPPGGSVSSGGYVLSGMIGELDGDRADIAIGALSINPEREKYIDFSEPWHYHGIQLLEKWVCFI